MTPRNQTIQDQLHTFEFMGRHIVTEEVKSSFFLHELDTQFNEEFVKESIDFLRAVHRVNTGEEKDADNTHGQLKDIIQKYLETARVQPRGFAVLWKKFKIFFSWKKQESPSATVNIPSHETDHLVDRFQQHTLSLEDFEDANTTLMNMLISNVFPRLSGGSSATNLTRALELDRLIEQNPRMRNIREALATHFSIPHTKHMLMKGPLEDSHKQVKKMQKKLDNIANETLALLDAKTGSMGERDKFKQERLQIMNDFRDKIFDEEFIKLCDKYAQKLWNIITTKHHLPKKASKTFDCVDVSTIISKDAEPSSMGVEEIFPEAETHTPPALPRKVSSNKELIKAGHSRTEMNVILDLYVTLRGYGQLDATAKADEIFALSMQLEMEEEKVGHRGRSRTRTSSHHRTPSPSPSPARVHTPVSTSPEQSVSFLPMSASSFDSTRSPLRLSSASDRSDFSVRSRSASHARRNALIAESLPSSVEYEEPDSTNDTSLPPAHPTAAGQAVSSAPSYSAHSLFHSQNRTNTRQAGHLTAGLPPRSISAPKRDVSEHKTYARGHRALRVNLFGRGTSIPEEPQSSVRTDAGATIVPSKIRP